MSIDMISQKYKIRIVVGILQTWHIRQMTLDIEEMALASPSSAQDSYLLLFPFAKISQQICFMSFMQLIGCYLRKKRKENGDKMKYYLFWRLFVIAISSIH